MGAIWRLAWFSASQHCSLQSWNLSPLSNAKSGVRHACPQPLKARLPRHISHSTRASYRMVYAKTSDESKTAVILTVYLWWNWPIYCFLPGLILKQRDSRCGGPKVVTIFIFCLVWCSAHAMQCARCFAPPFCCFTFQSALRLFCSLFLPCMVIVIMVTYLRFPKKVRRIEKVLKYRWLSVRTNREGALNFYCFVTFSHNSHHRLGEISKAGLA